MLHIILSLVRMRQERDVLYVVLWFLEWFLHAAYICLPIRLGAMSTISASWIVQLISSSVLRAFFEICADVGLVSSKMQNRAHVLGFTVCCFSMLMPWSSYPNQPVVERFKGVVGGKV